MRIIAGRFKGHRLQSPRGRDVRPTADRVRESIFNLLATRTFIDDAVVLDAFCGTGAFGLEAISRGAGSAVFVDTSRDALTIAAQNAAALGVEDRCLFLLRDAIRYLRNSKSTFDLIFADPPYTFEHVEAIPPLAAKVLNPTGLFVLEHDKRQRFDDEPSKIESRSYGRTIVTIFRASTTSAPNREQAT